MRWWRRRRRRRPAPTPVSRWSCTSPPRQGLSRPRSASSAAPTLPMPGLIQVRKWGDAGLLPPATGAREGSLIGESPRLLSDWNRAVHVTALSSLPVLSFLLFPSLSPVPAVVGDAARCLDPEHRRAPAVEYHVETNEVMWPSLHAERRFAGYRDDTFLATSSSTLRVPVSGDYRLRFRCDQLTTSALCAATLRSSRCSFCVTSCLGF